MQNPARRTRGETQRSEATGTPPLPKSQTLKKIGRFAISPPLINPDCEARRSSTQSTPPSDVIRNPKVVIESFNNLGHLIQDLLERNSALEDENCRLHQEINLLKASFRTDESGTNSFPTTEEEEIGVRTHTRLMNH